MSNEGPGQGKKLWGTVARVQGPAQSEVMTASVGPRAVTLTTGGMIGPIPKAWREAGQELKH